MPTPITKEQVAQYKSKTRKRGEYLDVLIAFLSSKESALAYDLVSDFPGRKLNSVKSGFVTAVETAVTVAKDAGTEVPNVTVASDTESQTVALINNAKL